MSHSVVTWSFARTLLVAGLTCLLIHSYVAHMSTEALYSILATTLPASRHGVSDKMAAEAFVSAAMEDTLQRYNSSAIKKFCDHGHWNNNIAVSCDLPFGGIGNVKQEILSCVRFAMAEGNGLIIPSMQLRSSEDLSELHSGSAEFDYLFDRQLFDIRLGAACPQMAIYDTIEEAELAGNEIYHYPVTLTKMSICDDPAEFAVHFGSIISYPTYVYRLAFTALHYLDERYHIPISPSLADSSLPTYLGIHLRTAKDAVDWGSFAPYEFQRDYYVSTAYALNLPVVYVASGNLTSVEMFAERAKLYMPHLKVVTKENLLFGSDLEELRSLSWDQAALVDYVILERASFFAGMKETSFSWNVMMTRAAARGGEDTVCGPQQQLGEHEAWRDPWSVISGFSPEGWDHENVVFWS